jgi:hypothetical protein
MPSLLLLAGNVICFLSPPFALLAGQPTASGTAMECPAAHIAHVDTCAGTFR